KNYASNDDDKTVLDVIFTSTIIARPYIAPPGIPAERVKALRDGFIATMRDPEFLAETGKLGLTIDPTSGEEMERIVRDAYALPEAVKLKVRRALADSPFLTSPACGQVRPRTHARPSQRRVGVDHGTPHVGHRRVVAAESLLRLTE